MERKSMFRAFIDGFVSLGDGIASIFGFRPYGHENGCKTDAESIASDWKQVGDDMRSAMKQMDRRIADTFMNKSDLTSEEIDRVEATKYFPKFVIAAAWEAIRIRENSGRKMSIRDVLDEDKARLRSAKY